MSPITRHIVFIGPVSPDTVFHRAIEGEFDAVLCMYHDQGLIPLKLHAFHSGVNVTLGLPFPRTSPDHGTAFEIAGKGIARPDSMIAAINLAVELAQNEDQRTDRNRIAEAARQLRDPAPYATLIATLRCVFLMLVLDFSSIRLRLGARA